MMRRMGITDEDLDNISNEMMGAFGGAESLEGLTDADDPDADNGDEDGKTATFPFLSRFSAARPLRTTHRAARPSRRRARAAIRNPKRAVSTNSWILTASTFPSARATASSTRLLAARRRSSALSRSSTAARRTTPASSVSRASARLPSPKDLPSASWRVRCPSSSEARRSTCLI